jgi:hypothetical protein
VNLAAMAARLGATMVLFVIWRAASTLLLHEFD